jgi:hypothetical protein
VNAQKWQPESLLFLRALQQEKKWVAKEFGGEKIIPGAFPECASSKAPANLEGLVRAQGRILLNLRIGSSGTMLTQYCDRQRLGPCRIQRPIRGVDATKITFQTPELRVDISSLWILADVGASPPVPAIPIYLCLHCAHINVH